MALNDCKLTDAQIAAVGVQSQPNKLTGTAQQNKAVFDALVKDLVKVKFNSLIDALTGAGAAAQIGVDTITGLTAATVQEALQAIVEAMADITQGSVADGSITDDKLADSAVTADKIDDGAVTADKIADHSVGWYQLELADTEENGKGIYTSNIRNGQITASKLADNAVVTARIKNKAVTGEKLADAAVDTTKLALGAVTTVKITDAAVTTAKIALLAVTEALLAANAVTTAKIKNKNVTAEKIADHAVGWYQLELADTEENGKGIYASNIRNGQITAAKLAGDIKPVNVGIKHGTVTPTTSTISNGQIYLKHA